MGGKTLWVVSTSALLLGVPWALAYSEEQMIVEQERAELQAQRAQNEVRPFVSFILSFFSKTTILFQAARASLSYVS